MSDQSKTIGLKASLPTFAEAEHLPKSGIDPEPFGFDICEGPIFEFRPQFTTGQWVDSLPLRAVNRAPLHIEIGDRMSFHLKVESCQLFGAGFWLAMGALDDARQTRVKVLLMLDDDSKPMTVLMQRLLPAGADIVRPLRVRLS